MRGSIYEEEALQRAEQRALCPPQESRLQAEFENICERQRELQDTLSLLTEEVSELRAQLNDLQYWI